MFLLCSFTVMRLLPPPTHTQTHTHAPTPANARAHTCAQSPPHTHALQPSATRQLCAHASASRAASHPLCRLGDPHCRWRMAGCLSAASQAWQPSDGSLGCAHWYAWRCLRAPRVSLFAPERQGHSGSSARCGRREQKAAAECSHGARCCSTQGAALWSSQLARAEPLRWRWSASDAF